MGMARTRRRLSDVGRRTDGRWEEGRTCFSPRARAGYYQPGIAGEASDSRGGPGFGGGDTAHTLTLAFTPDDSLRTAS